jgi:hypothetical protein
LEKQPLKDEIVYIKKSLNPLEKNVT